MANPILTMLNRNTGANGILSTISTVKNIMSSGDPSQIVQAEMQRNPQFAEFVRQHQGKSVDELITESGIDAGILRSLF